MFNIEKPIWSTESVGLNEKRIITDPIQFQIQYKDRHGNKVYPGIYQTTREHILSCPVQYIKRNKIRLVRIEDCKRLEE